MAWEISLRVFPTGHIKGSRCSLSWLPYILIGLDGLLIGLQIVSLNQVGAPLGNFTSVGLQGQNVHLNDDKGKAVLVNAWAAWCPPCLAEMPDINAYYQEHQKDDFMVLVANAGDPHSSAAAFAQSNQLEIPILLDLNLLGGLGWGFMIFLPRSLLAEMGG